MGYAECMPIHHLFQTPVYSAVLGSASAASLNRRLLRESLQLRLDDRAGRAWSVRNYPAGYTSYNSQSRLQHVSPIFAQLERRIDRHVVRFAKSLDYELRGKRLQMTDCWVNIMRRRGVHGLHLHPLSTISGTYYVQVPRGSSGLKFEDPRLAQFMAAPRATLPGACAQSHLGNVAGTRRPPDPVRELAASRGVIEPGTLASASASVSTTAGSRR